MAHNIVYRHFDLPVKHLDRGFDYIPPKARRAEEIERRKRLPEGTLLAEYQHRGIAVARDVLRIVAKSCDDPFVPRILAATEFNTAWYNHAAGARNVMRRRLYLPRLDEWRGDFTSQTIANEAAIDLEQCERLAAIHVMSVRERHCATPRLEKKLGRSLGNTSLRLISAAHVRELRNCYGEPALLQQTARQAALDVVERSRELCADIGSNPSLAQFADHDSPLSVYWRRHAPTAAVDALEQASSGEIQ